ncbi:MAG: tripartite tricarboxylate transporter TctB family protein [Desulfuromonadales bacterium]|nr:tripartite tricarboxylate transporter TctB family protein [Desulfuromonadales bacterium]
MSGIILTAFGILMLIVIIPQAVPVDFVPPGQISPRFLPKVISAAITVIALLLLVSNLYKCARLKSAAAQVDDTGESPAEKSDLKTAAESKPAAFLKWAPGISIFLIVAYYFLLIWTGFIVSSIVTMVCVMLTFGERRWWVIVSASAIVPALVWAFAVKLLNLPMP